MPGSAIPNQAVTEFDLYIDDSASMRGYASLPDSHYVRVMNHILDAGATGNLSVTPYRFSSGIAPVGNLGIAQLLSPQFYGGLDTPLSRLLEHIGVSPNRMSVIVSDLVQSDKTNDERALVKALRELARKRVEIRLLGFRSGFRGDYYVEHAPYAGHAQRKIPLTLDQSVPGGGRPFYLLVIAPNRGVPGSTLQLCTQQGWRTRSLRPRRCRSYRY